MAGERSLANLNNNEAVAVLITSNGSSGSRQKCNNIANDGLKLKWQEIYAWNGCGSWLFYLLSILLLCDTCQAHSNQCAPGLITPGRTWPHGDIFLEHGQSLTIYCMLNENLTDPLIRDKNSSDLVFIRNEEKIKSEHITVINETTIMMYIEKPAPSEETYFCKVRLNDSHNEQYVPVCINKVLVGFKPQEPKRFDCISKNWENLTCTWEPAPNYVPTDFSLYFKFTGRAGGRSLYPCPIPRPGVDLPPNTCLWDATTYPKYRLGFQFYMFKLNAANVLGNTTFFYRFHHWAHVIPSKPVDLTLVNKTESSVLLLWKIPHAMQSFPSGLHHRISYRSERHGERTWKIINITTDERDIEKYFNLTNLQYANTVYDIKVYMKSAIAFGEDKWSQPSSITVKTAAKLPSLPIRTDLGNFEIAKNNSHRDVYVYWILPNSEDRDNFEFEIVHVEESGRKVDLQPTEITKAYAKFGGLSFNSSFKFEIVSKNFDGTIKEKVIVYVPNQSEMPQEPAAFTRVAFGKGLYELSWNPSNSSDIITDYTIFWCEKDQNRLHQCSDNLEWVHVSRNENMHGIEVSDRATVYRFAIAANTESGSSGMVWASCLATRKGRVGEMKSLWINRIESDSIEIGWRLDCSDRIEPIEAFNIYCCPITDPHNLTCSSPRMNTTVKSRSGTIHSIVRGLKPGTTYMLTVAVVTRIGEGLHSDPLHETTLEGASTPAPQSYVVSNVTNTTFMTAQQPRIPMNGTILYYILILFFIYLTHILNK